MEISIFKDIYYGISLKKRNIPRQFYMNLAKYIKKKFNKMLKSIV